MDDDMDRRLIALNHATDFVKPIIQQHELTDNKVVYAMFNSSTESKVEQHISVVLQVADWLLGLS